MPDSSYVLARDVYAQCGVDTDEVIRRMKNISLSLHCWQGDDVRGFESSSESIESGGIKVTGKYPGAARSLDELRQDLEKVFSLLPGSHRLNLHAMYGDFGGKKVSRDKIAREHFASWLEWADAHVLALDFNPTCFAHPLADSGFTLSSKDADVRKFWIEHVIRCRDISAYLGEALGSPCVCNLWIPDGSKDITVNRMRHRHILRESLDAVFAIDYPVAQMKDALESKLFGIGSESFVVGSHEFYLGYALSRGKMICLDMGHFHPTESIADKISALLQFCAELLLHISRGVRWDSDHVVILDDPLTDLAHEIVRADALQRVHFGLDFFDASINRVGAWAIGARSTLKALLYALLEPHMQLREYEENGRLFERLALLEKMKTKPFGAVWEHYCAESGAPRESELIEEVRAYETEVLASRK